MEILTQYAYSMPSANAAAAAGALAGLVEAITVHPLDMIKTRSQHQLNVQANESIAKSVRSLLQEGGVRRMYRGLVPEIVGMTPTRSAMYAGFDVAKQILSSTSSLPERWVAALAGAFAGLPEALATTPFQVVKVRMQAKEHAGRYASSIDCVVKTVHHQGVAGLMTGVTATIWRNSGTVA